MKQPLARSFILTATLLGLTACGGGGGGDGGSSTTTGGNPPPTNPTTPTPPVPPTPTPTPTPPPTPTTPVPDGVLPAAVASALLNAHNAVRDAEQVNLPKLNWSEPLAKFAQEWADHLKASNSCTMRHRADSQRLFNNQVTGENLYYSWSSVPYTGFQSTPEAVIKLWADEKPDYSFVTRNCAPNKACGHYTQIIWKSTTTVGCGRAQCNTQEIWVCNYLPAGNVSGQNPY
ncbi:uncharacterized protein YkwD [Chitinivorax tropicus]|uniref:Uncharacterized protein YkwD n=1 Tax=Chitinivorax tropicus TaxID=714531 RepID=A0A840MNB2_9PROT|nr:CAP domain-containing protein [Chitinivorax tropicus]MBB5020128.1 uncharacterized protein YkwD [Chitinivorax tropicus]